MSANHSIIINNYNNNDAVSYSCILLKGNILTSYTSSCNKRNNKLIINNGDGNSTAELYNNKFRALISLNLGENKISITYCCYKIEFIINFKPKNTNFCVVPLYIICKNHNGYFQAPENEENTPENACKRISTGLKLIQTIIAEKFYESGLLRKTFQLENDINASVPKCRIFQSQLDYKTARSMTQNELWSHFAREIMESDLKNNNHKHIAFISCTKYRGEKFGPNIKNHDDIINITEAHVALGGGGLAIFGSACLYTWPETLINVFEYFLNEDIIDKTKFMDDSCYRGTKGTCFATTLGSVCHELCHTFDLGHTEYGVMGRGFDNINKEFIFENSKKAIKPKNKEELPLEIQKQDIVLKITQNIAQKEDRIKYVPPIFNKDESTKILDKNGMFWTPNCAVLLYNHKWLNIYSETRNYILEFRNNRTQIFSSLGLKIIEIRENNSENFIKWYDFSKRIQNIFSVPNFSNLEKDIILIAQDSEGNILKEYLN